MDMRSLVLGERNRHKMQCTHEDSGFMFALNNREARRARKRICKKRITAKTGRPLPEAFQNLVEDWK